MGKLAFAMLLMAGGVCLAQTPTPVKKRIAVFDFDNARVAAAPQMIFFTSTPPNVGKSAADLLVTRLVQGGKASVIERAAIAKLIAEQNFSNSDRADPITAARIGRILGVDAIILGTITRYDYQDKTKGGGGGFARIGINSMSTKHDIFARIQVDARIVSTDTAEVLNAVSGSGEVLKKGVKIDARDLGPIMMAGGGAGPNNPIMSEVMDKAIAQLASQVEQKLPAIPQHVLTVEGLIADVNDTGRLVLNVGSRDGVKQGDRLQVYRIGKEIRDPATGKVLLRDDTPLGEAVVTVVNEGSSFAQYAGAEKPQVGDAVKTPTKH